MKTNDYNYVFAFNKAVRNSSFIERFMFISELLSLLLIPSTDTINFGAFIFAFVVGSISGLGKLFKKYVKACFSF